jgi:RimJ/RimL family protein N-acetyltransferase
MAENKNVRPESLVLAGRHIRLERLGLQHVDSLVAASAEDRQLYQWSPVPQGKVEATKYIETALAWREAGSAVPFAIVTNIVTNNANLNSKSDGNSKSATSGGGGVIGSTRFFNLEFWAWPLGHARHGRTVPDACEIGYTWLTRSAIRTAANTEAKLLMLTYAFETWEVLRVCLHTDVRNERSRAAIERIGGKFEGILRAHRMAADFIARDSARFSIVAAEWPEVKERLSRMLDQPK